MSPRLAPIKGSSSIYGYLQDGTVLLMKNNYKYFVTSRQAFHDLYYRLDDSKAALKEDCIEYTVYHPETPLSWYPDWYIEAYDNGMIFEDSGNFLCCYNKDDMVMTPGSVVLYNHLGQIKNMERYQFEHYYEPMGGNHYES